MQVKNKLALLGTLCALFVLIFASQQVIDSARYALSLCAGLILPSLFPFFVLSVLLNRLGLPQHLGKLLASAAERLLHCSGAGVSALLIGVTGGYPLGAAYIADMLHAKVIDTDEAEYLMAFCNNSGPAFIIGAMGIGVFGSPGIGLILYAIHIASAVCTGLIMRPEKRSDSSGVSEPRAVSFSGAFPEAVKQSVASALTVCGFVVCFSVFVGVLDSWGLFDLIPSDLARAGIIGFLELGSGTGAMQGMTPSPEALAMAAGILGWGGISVHMQTMAVIGGTEIKGTLHTAGRLMSAVLSALLGYIAGLLLF